MIKNKFSRSLVDMANNHAELWEVMTAGVGKIRQAYVEGDIEWGSLACGQVCGLIEGIPTCRELIDGIVAEAGRVVQSVQTRVQGAAD